MNAEAIDKILEISAPHEITVGDLNFVDKEMHLEAPPQAPMVSCTTLQGLVDLLAEEIEDVKAGPDVLVQIQSPFCVALVSRKSDGYGRREYYAEAKYPKECTTFKFGEWHTVENFIIACQQGFQRVKIQNDNGSFSKDLDYVLSTASKISADSSVSNEDDGITQRVNVQTGVVLKAEMPLRPRVNLAPFRTFAEIDQVVSTFIFRARSQNGAVHLALFEGDGGRWRLAAVAAIKAWLAQQITASPIIS